MCKVVASLLFKEHGDLAHSSFRGECGRGLGGGGGESVDTKQINLIGPQSSVKSLNGAELTGRTWIRSGKNNVTGDGGGKIFRGWSL